MAFRIRVDLRLSISIRFEQFNLFERKKKYLYLDVYYDKCEKVQSKDYWKVITEFAETYRKWKQSLFRSVCFTSFEEVCVGNWAAYIPSLNTLLKTRISRGFFRFLQNNIQLCTCMLRNCILDSKLSKIILLVLRFV